MNWENIKEEMPEKDVSFLAFCNGGYRLATRYGDTIHDDTTLERIECQYWCEITPPKKK